MAAAIPDRQPCLTARALHNAATANRWRLPEPSTCRGVCIGRSAPEDARGSTVDGKSVLIGVLVVALAVVGYLYWDSQRSKLEIRAPGVTIKGG